MSKLAMPRCRLEAISERDEPLLIALHTSDQVRRYLGGVSTAKTARRHLDQLINSTDQAMTIVLRQTEERIGTISFNAHHDGEYVEVSYMVLPRLWGAGLVTEALGSALDHRFDADSGLDHIVAETQIANTSSCRLLERLGFSEIRRLQRFGAEQSLYIKHR